MTIRNGNQNNPKYEKPYAEKLLISDEDQVCPMHFHWKKMEDSRLPESMPKHFLIRVLKFFKVCFITYNQGNPATLLANHTPSH